MRRFLFGTDWWTDCDDAVALRLICNHVKEQKAELLGVGINACMDYSVASVKGFLLAEGLEGIPIGIDPAATDFGGNPPYQKRLAKDFCPYGTNADAEDAVRLYRRALAESKGQLELIEVGFLQVVAAVLESGADDISPKSGRDLVAEKVKKIWVMAGKWDADGERENNFCRNPRSRVAAESFCRLCPVPVTFLGWEVGYGVLSGGCLEENDHLYRVLLDHDSSGGRHSWDPMLTLLALIGDEEKAGYDTVCGKASVDAENGANYFVNSPDGLHTYVIKKFENSYYSEAIDNLI